MLVLCPLVCHRGALRLSCLSKSSSSPLPCTEVKFNAGLSSLPFSPLSRNPNGNSLSPSLSCRLCFSGFPRVYLGFSSSKNCSKLLPSGEFNSVRKINKKMASDLFSFGELQDSKIAPESTPNQVVTRGELKNVQGLATWLEERLPGGRAQLETWGRTAGSKPLANLWRELVDGEISLNDSDPPKRTVHVASVKIKNSVGKVLIESHQEMENGKVRNRNRYLSEKMKDGENVSDACFRGIMEELGDVVGEKEKVNIVCGSYRREDMERESYSYPGLLTKYIVHSMSAKIDDLPENDFSTLENESQFGSLEGCKCSSRGKELLLESNVSNVNTNLCICRLEEQGIEEMGGKKETEQVIGVRRHFWVWKDE